MHRNDEQADRRTRTRHLLATCILVALLMVAACAPHAGEAPQPRPEGVEAEPVEADLAALMGEMQRHSMKLAYSIEARNAPLASFYAHEVEEVLESVEQVAEHDGVAIGLPARGALRQPLESLEAAVEDGDWQAAQDRYETLTDGCNSCHEATGHGFVVITEPPQPPPFNQSFLPLADRP